MVSVEVRSRRGIHVTVSAAILAGGQARRFGGRDKGALLVDGRSIRDRQVAELATLTSDILIVGGHESPRPERAPASRRVPDRLPGCGPLGGLHTALLESAGDVTIVIACDMPYVSAPMLVHLCTLAREADAVVPRTDRGYHPLCAVYGRACLDPVARRLAAGRLKMTDLFDDVRVRAVTAEELSAFGDVNRLLANVNTPAEHRELDALQDHQL
jgi:molybdopterin-guanine dinucleotide biosynthesis protein A